MPIWPAHRHTPYGWQNGVHDRWPAGARGAHGFALFSARGVPVLDAGVPGPADVGHAAAAPGDGPGSLQPAYASFPVQPGTYAGPLSPTSSPWR